MTLTDQSESFSRLSLLVGDDGLALLSRSRILVCGLGGVGSWAAETLARSAIGHLSLLDFDTIRASNLNRQIHALHSTLGLTKTEAMRRRLLDINPELDLEILNFRLTEENAAENLPAGKWDFVIDAIDERRPKIALIRQCLATGTPLISSLGSACKTHPEMVTVADISETSGCPLAKILRKTLKHYGITTGLRVVYSPELPILPEEVPDPEQEGERHPLGTIAFLPALCGLRCAAEAINFLLASRKLSRRGQTPRRQTSEPL